MAKIDELKDFHPLTRKAWRDWLAKNYDKSSGVWFVYFKKHTGKPRVSYDEAVEEALCFGWVDSLPRKLDEDRTKLLFTPRKPKSVWSQLNKERVDKLIANKAMTEPGLAKIEAAKKDGSWDALNASDSLEIAEDLANAFTKNLTAERNFMAFPNGVKKAILQWLNSAKRPETRAARIVKIVAMAANNKRANFDKE
jgi:uncharacterized protein YdeI (YjbR/CyaY-like superfamily)